MPSMPDLSYEKNSFFTTKFKRQKSFYTLLDMTAQEIIKALALKPHPKEGGYYIETYRSEEAITGIPNRYLQRSKGFSTAIYYLLTSQTFSRMHRLLSDEVFHFYDGAPVRMLLLFPEGRYEIRILGSSILSGQEPQVIVPKGVWQGLCLVEGGEFALLGTTVAPAFEYEDYEEGERNNLIEKYPAQKELIIRLTP